MPEYSVATKEEANLVPNVSKQAQKDIEMYDGMVWKKGTEFFGVDEGLIFENPKKEKLRILRVIMPGGAFSARRSEVLRKNKSGKPEVWRTVDADGPNVDILAMKIVDGAGVTGEHIHLTVSEFDAWLGGKEPKINRYKVPEDVGSKKYEATMIAAAARRKHHEEALQKEAGRGK